MNYYFPFLPSPGYTRPINVPIILKLYFECVLLLNLVVWKPLPPAGACYSTYMQPEHEQVYINIYYMKYIIYTEMCRRY